VRDDRNRRYHRAGLEPMATMDEVGEEDEEKVE
jgi:hypothetical protein